jgi:cytochrome c oxidase cbb3-type subunit 1
MQAALATAERQIGIGLAVILALGGLVMAAAARQGVMAGHGAMALALGPGLVFRLDGSALRCGTRWPRPGRPL